MKLFVIYGQDCLYQGSGGMVEHEICEAENYQDALLLAKEISYNIINSYSQIYDTLEEDWQSECDFYDIEDLESDEAQSLLNEIINEDLDYGCIELDKEKLPTLNDQALDEMLFNDPEDFIDTYKL